MILDANPHVGAILYGAGLDPIRDWRKWQAILLRLDYRSGLIGGWRYEWCARELARAVSLAKWEQWYERAGSRPLMNPYDSDGARAVKKVQAERRSGVVIYDNARPAGEYDGPGQSPIPAGPCCRDGFARSSVRRPLEWGRPRPPTPREYHHRLYQLCPGCVTRRLNWGAYREEDESVFNRSLAHGRWAGVVRTDDALGELEEDILKE